MAIVVLGDRLFYFLVDNESLPPRTKFKMTAYKTMNKQTLTLEQKIAIGRKLIRGIKLFVKILGAIGQVIKAERQQPRQNIVDANKRNPDQWARKNPPAKN